MEKRALIIRHMKAMCDDRVSGQLKAAGFALDYRCPAEGEALPELDEGHVLAVVYGGVQSANDDGYIDEEIAWIRDWVLAGRPYLGLCLGGQLLARALGAPVAGHQAGRHEIGFVKISPVGDNGFLRAPLHVYQWHKEGFEIPDGAELLATGEIFPNQAFRFGNAAYGLQFHPEVTPEIMHGWMKEAAAMLDAPGASSREQQIEDAAAHSTRMGRWLENFLFDWLPKPSRRGNGAAVAGREAC